MTDKLGDSTQEQALLRAVALWAANYAEATLAIFERYHPKDPRPRQAIEAAREYGQGKKRDKNLRVVALAAFKAAKDIDEASKYAARAATLSASVAYAHTDLQTGLQGIRQARHILGPIVYAAFALEAAKGERAVADDFIRQAAQTAPPEAKQILKHMPPQTKKPGRVEELFFELDSALRG
ncbi:MAG TPA: hypothetical protein VFZ48_03745 [Candidatus Saccharimonadales bacterium]